MSDTDPPPGLAALEAERDGYSPWYRELDWPAKRQVQSIQWDLIQAGWATLTFPYRNAMACWVEACRRFRTGNATNKPPEPTAVVVSARRLNRLTKWDA